MPIIGTLTQFQFVDKSSREVDGRIGHPSNGPAFPDVDRLGKSRIGRKLHRKALDRYHADRRRYEGRPAKSGPPIPNSEKHGRREFYSLEQCRRGGRRSGEARRRKAAKKWREVCTLRHRGFGIRQIARIVGYSAAWVSKLVKRLWSNPAEALTEHYHHQPTRPLWASHGSRVLTLAVLYRRHSLERASEPGHQRPERNRLDRAFSRSQARIIGRRRKRPSAGLLGAIGGGSGISLGLALAASQELAGLPIDEAVQSVNRAFGWRYE